MEYTNLSVETWSQLNSSGNLVNGYNAVWLALEDNNESILHIFKDEVAKLHLAIEDNAARKEKISDPNVSGLSIDVKQYRIGSGAIKKVIDIKCELIGFIGEFTEIVKEIAKAILVYKEVPTEAVNRIINNWKAFWSKKNNPRLSEEQQIGLICELLVLKELCKVNTENAINSWVGPFAERHDFIFTDWSLEVKGTRSANCKHTINGLDQLKPLDGRSLAFVSFCSFCGRK